MLRKTVWSRIVVFLMTLFVARQSRSQQAPQAPASHDSAIRVSVDSVLVPVVVRDRQGHAIGGLTKEDFQIFDRGKPRKISGFTVETRSNLPTASSPESSPATSTAAPDPAHVATPPNVEPPPRCTVLLFDDMHLNEGDLMRAKAVGTKLLEKPIGKREAVAVVSMSGKNSGLTQNPAKLREAVAALSVKNLSEGARPVVPTSAITKQT